MRDTMSERENRDLKGQYRCLNEEKGNRPGQINTGIEPWWF